MRVRASAGSRPVFSSGEIQSGTEGYTIPDSHALPPGEYYVRVRQRDQYQPDGWGKALRFVALRYAEATQPADEVEQYQLFATNRYTYRVFVTSLK